VDIAVGATGPVRVDVETDAGRPLLAVAAPAAGDVERDRAEVALMDELHARPGRHDLTGDLVAQDQVLGCGGAAPDHVLVRAADVGGDDLEDRAVGDGAPDVVGVDTGPVLELELGIGDVLDLGPARLEVGDAAVAGHGALAVPAPAGVPL